MRTRVTAAACFVVLAAVAIAQQFPLRQNVEVLTEAPMRPVKVKDGLFIIRGPAMPCMTGCRPGDKGDGLIHESGDVAVRVTTDGLIVVDDKFASQAADVFAQVKKVSPLPVKYVLNTHHHADHASGNQYARDTFGVNIIAQKNIRANFLRIKQPGEPNITFGNEAQVYLGGVEVRLHWFGRAHTNGDTVIEFPDLKTIHTGDIIIDAIPVIDYPGGGSAIEFLTTIDRMLTLDFDTAILGHGRTMTKQEVRDYRMRFAEMNRRLKALIDRGVTKDPAQDVGSGTRRAEARGAGLGEHRQLDDLLRRLPGLFRRDRGLEITQILPEDRTMVRPRPARSVAAVKSGMKVPRVSVTRTSN
jgi:glyoxylase-like metal-dependent hydrolase (beta-lactamase superfamily II)